MKLVERGGGRSSSPPPDFISEMLDRDFGRDTEAFKKALSQVAWSVLEKDGFRDDMRELSRQTSMLAYIFNRCSIKISDRNGRFVNLWVLYGGVSDPFALLTKVLGFYKCSSLIKDIIEVAEKETKRPGSGVHVSDGNFDNIKLLLSVEMSPDVIADLERLVDGDIGLGHFNYLFNWNIGRTTYQGWEMIPKTLYKDEKAPGLLDRFHRRCEKRQKTALLQGYSKLQERGKDYVYQWGPQLRAALKVANELVALYSFILVAAKIDGENIYISGVED